MPLLAAGLEVRDLAEGLLLRSLGLWRIAAALVAAGWREALPKQTETAPAGKTLWDSRAATARWTPGYLRTWFEIGLRGLANELLTRLGHRHMPDLRRWLSEAFLNRKGSPMVDSRQAHLRLQVSRLSEILTATTNALEDAISILQAEIDDSTASRCDSRTSTIGTPSPDFPIVDHHRLCVTYHGRCCFLGNTLKFRLLERLIRRLNRYVSYDDLMADVWNADREPSTIRSLVKELRVALRDAGMPELADSIDGHESGHYGLILHQTG